MATILVVGEDFELLKIRAAVLRLTGAEAMCSSGTSASGILANRHFDLVVICHTLSARLCSSLVGVIRSRWPQTHIMRLVPAYHATDADRSVDGISSADPESLVRNTSEQLKLIEEAAMHSEASKSSAVSADAVPEVSD